MTASRSVPAGVVAAAVLQAHCRAKERFLFGRRSRVVWFGEGFGQRRMKASVFAATAALRFFYVLRLCLWHGNYPKVRLFVACPPLLLWASTHSPKLHTGCMPFSLLEWVPVPSSSVNSACNHLADANSDSQDNDTRFILQK
jgi:hypothetical protein